jgi:hypothetical protein
MIFKQVIFQEEIEYPVLGLRNPSLKSGFYEITNIITGASLICFAFPIKMESSCNNTLYLPGHLQSFFNSHNHEDLFLKVASVDFKEGKFTLGEDIMYS